MRVMSAAIFVLSAMGSACARAPSATDLVGTYVLSIETDTLHLAASGQYRRVFAQVGAPRTFAIDTGRWRVSNNGRLVALSALPQRWPAHGRYDSVSGTWHQPDTLQRGMVSLQINATWTGAVVLDVVPELGWRYRRVRRIAR